MTTLTTADSVRHVMDKKRSAQDINTNSNKNVVLPTVQNKHIRQEACICSIALGKEKVCRYMPDMVNLCTLREVLSEFITIGRWLSSSRC
jgi:hypothetical protein